MGFVMALWRFEKWFKQKGELKQRAAACNRMAQITFFFFFSFLSPCLPAEEGGGCPPDPGRAGSPGGAGECYPGCRASLGEVPGWGGMVAPSVCVSVCLSEGSVLLARTSCWHSTKAGSKVTEMSTETQADTHTEPSSERFNPLAPSSHAALGLEGGRGSAQPWDADGFMCWWQTQQHSLELEGAWTVLCPLKVEEDAEGCSVSTARLQLPQPAGIRTRTLPISVSLMHREAEKTT